MTHAVQLNPTVRLQTTSDDTPTLPPWFPEATIVAHVIQQRGLIDHIATTVTVPRGRIGTYDVVDFWWYLVVYCISGEPSLAAFEQRLTPAIAHIIAGLIHRETLPSRATLSRFLNDVTDESLAAMRGVILRDLLAHGIRDESLGGLWDHQGDRWIIFDLDATRNAARKRSLITDKTHPLPRRRLAAMCAPGYTGHKRGEHVHTRSVLSLASTQELLGSFGSAGNGDIIVEFKQSITICGEYLDTHGIPRNRAIMRLDGAYGYAKRLALLQQHGIGFVVRCADYTLLQHPHIMAHRQQTTPVPFYPADSSTRYEVIDAGWIHDWASVQTIVPVSCRVILLRRDAQTVSSKRRHGKVVQEDGKIYEIIVTTMPAMSVTATEVVQLYHQRGTCEQLFADEDREMNMDRWYSMQPTGQAFAQTIAQTVWNIRITLGNLACDEPVRQTTWADAPDAALCDGSSPVVVTTPTTSPSDTEPIDSIDCPTNEMTNYTTDVAKGETAAVSQHDDSTMLLLLLKHLMIGFVLVLNTHRRIRTRRTQRGKRLHEIDDRAASGTAPDTPSITETSPIIPSPDDTSQTAVPSPSAPPNDVDDTVSPPRIRTLVQADHGRLTGRNFTFQADGSVQCPAGHTMHQKERIVYPTGDERVRCIGKKPTCQTCPLRSQCLVPGGTSARSVTVMIRQAAVTTAVSYETHNDEATWHYPALLWGDSGGGAVRRWVVELLRRQTVHVTEYPGETERASPDQTGRAARAHRRLSWHDLYNRNARRTTSLRYHIHLTGIPESWYAVIGTMYGTVLSEKPRETPL
jgi:hypothetical protein